ncbi:MAG: hypothetical protein JSR45_02800 [Proteobacteria bacterium]|nr:hypothetical protein [Pseudomonadota bacterium]
MLHVRLLGFLIAAVGVVLIVFLWTDVAAGPSRFAITAGIPIFMLTLAAAMIAVVFGAHLVALPRSAKRTWLSDKRRPDAQ